MAPTELASQLRRHAAIASSTDRAAVFTEAADLIDWSLAEIDRLKRSAAANALAGVDPTTRVS